MILSTVEKPESKKKLQNLTLSFMEASYNCDGFLSDIWVDFLSGFWKLRLHLPDWNSGERDAIGLNSPDECRHIHRLHSTCHTAW